jgi:hypothetical protein
MNLLLLIQLCGLPLIIIVAGMSLILTAVSCHLAFVSRRDELLAAFVPLTALPLVASMIATLVGNLSSIEMQLDENSTIDVDSALVIQMNLVPLLLGTLAAAPPALIASAGRLSLAHRGTTTDSRPSRDGTHESGMITPDEWAAREADAYVDQLTRSR